MHDPIPACFSVDRERARDDQYSLRAGQTLATNVYRTKIAGKCRLIVATWCKSLLAHGFTISLEDQEAKAQSTYKIELAPWCFWRKQGLKTFTVEGTRVDLFWDLRNAKFYTEPEPKCDYYVALASEGEVVLVLGDMKKEAYRKARSRPSLIDPILISRKEHIYAKRKFITRAKFSERAAAHEISIECTCGSNSAGLDPEMTIRIDGNLVTRVRHLQWKFRGNETIFVNKIAIEVFWDVHDWLFSPGLRHSLFIFRPSTSNPSSTLMNIGHGGSMNGSEVSMGGSPDFCLYLHAWKTE
ncbi:hypothetical protein AMTRI_Chr06g176440 [Amborella trichopoda]